MSDELPIEIESTRRLNVKPGETVVFKASGLTPDEAKNLQKRIAALLPDGVTALILAGGLKLVGVVAKPRHLPLGKRAYTDSQWSDLVAWLAALGVDAKDTHRVTLTDTEVTVTAYRRDAQGRHYAIGDEPATTYLTVPISDAPEWFTEVAG